MTEFPDIAGPGGDAIAKFAEGLLQLARTGWVEWGKGYACVYEIVGPPNKLSVNKISKRIPISHRYTNVTTFEQAGNAYMFGIHEDNRATIWRVNNDPSKGFAVEYYGRDPGKLTGMEAMRGAN